MEILAVILLPFFISNEFNLQMLAVTMIANILEFFTESSVYTWVKNIMRELS